MSQKIDYTQVQSSVGGSGNNLFVNGGCQVAQRSAATLSAAPTYGAVDRFQGSSQFSVQAGTIAQGTGLSYSATRNSFRLSGVSSTATNNFLISQKIEAVNVQHLKNNPFSISMVVNHDVGSNITANIYVYIPGASTDLYSDNLFTQQAASATLTIPTGTPSLIKLENITNIDTSNGIMVAVMLHMTGSITTKTFDVTNWQLNAGTTVQPFQPQPYDYEFRRCQRFYQRYVEPFMVGTTAANTTSVSRLGMALPVRMRTSPTVTLGALAYFDGSNVGTLGSITVNYTKPDYFQADVNTSGTISAQRLLVTYMNNTTAALALDAEIA